MHGDAVSKKSVHRCYEVALPSDPGPPLSYKDRSVFTSSLAFILILLFPEHLSNSPRGRFPQYISNLFVQPDNHALRSTFNFCNGYHGFRFTITRYETRDLR